MHLARWPIISDLCATEGVYKILGNGSGGDVTSDVEATPRDAMREIIGTANRHWETA